MIRPICRTLIDVPPCLNGPQVTLRPLGPADAPALLDAVEESRCELEPWLRSVSRIQDMDDATDYCARMADDFIDRYRLGFAIRFRDDDRFLGEVTLHRIDWELGSAEIGFWLRSGATGQGLMTEAVAMLADLFLGPLGGRRLVLRADARNRASVAIAVRLGFVHEATRSRPALRTNDRIRDVDVYALSRPVPDPSGDRIAVP